MKSQHHYWPAVQAVAIGTALVAGFWTFAANAQEMVSFKEDVYPILELRCLECHQPGGYGYQVSGFDMRTYENLMKGTRHGPIIVPRDAFGSNLIAAIDRRTDPALWMPHNQKKLSKCERLALRFWVSQGANDN